MSDSAFDYCTLTCVLCSEFGADPMSPTMMPNNHELVKKNNILATQRPGTKVLWPRNSSWNPCCSHNACASTQSTAALIPRDFCASREEFGR